MDENTVKRYPKGNFTVVWKPGKCIHAAECIKALPAVYHPKDKPWITLENASVDALKAQISKCPSGALSWEEKTNATHEEEKEEVANSGASVHVLPNGPLMVKGIIRLRA